MMHTETAPPGTAAPVFFVTDEEGHHSEGSTMLGFWLYLMSDCLIFATLFAAYGVLGRNYAAGPSQKDLFDLTGIAVNTAMLLFSSITYGFAMLEMDKNHQRATQMWLAVTGLFGIAFVSLEIREFVHLFHEGAPPWRSAFLSSFYTLVSTHGLHVSFGILWLATLMVQVQKHGLVAANKRRLMCLSMFWHFLDLIWIGVFTVVYLIGVLE